MNTTTKTIRRNQANKIFAAAKAARSYTLGNGFSGESISLGWVRQMQIEMFPTAKIRQTGNTVTLTEHSNSWITFEI